ncbi:MAG TPA: threonine synthase [Vicinamibacterales bacterium]|nr:threonine synthase [Vicinamibacterales bacterium]
MRLISTRHARHSATLSQAMIEGIAPDGGLYVPEHLPATSPADFEDTESLESIAHRVLQPFAAGDELHEDLSAICKEAFAFQAPVVPLDRAPGPAAVLELFHGPTCAFKDFGARFLAASLERVFRRSGRKLTLLVATSGDTGGAVAAAFHRRPWVDVVLLYPKGLVSARQAQQLACWGDNVRTFSVLGTFDDCQRIVKESLLDPVLARDRALSSANSINAGRLLPQMAYYAQASLRIFRDEGRKPHFIVPSGNLGNAVACVWAREMGLPIGEIVLATNENRVVVDHLAGGEWQPRASIATLASAMDVGNPSNMERLRALFPDVSRLRSHVRAYAVTDDEIRETIRTDAGTLGYVWCPHSATAAHVYRRVAAERAGDRWVIVATAHPAKFNETVEPLVGKELAVPTTLDRLLRLPRREEDLPPSTEALRARLQPRGQS